GGEGREGAPVPGGEGGGKSPLSPAGRGEKRGQPRPCCLREPCPSIIRGNRAAIRSRTQPACGYGSKLKKGREKMASANVVELTSANWENEVVNSEVPVMVDFWAPWCGPCRMLAPTIDRIADQFAGRIKVGKLNA